MKRYSYDTYNKQVGEILQRLDASRPSMFELKDIENRLDRLVVACRDDSELGTDRFKLYVAQAIIEFYRGNTVVARNFMEEAVGIRGGSFNFADEFLANLSPVESEVVTPPRPMSAHQRKSSGTGTGVLVVIIGIIVIVVWFQHLGSGSSSGDNIGSTNTSYSAETSGTIVKNPADLEVFAKIKNTGDSSGTPSCTLQANDDSSTYTGVDVVTRTSPLQAGGEWDFRDDMTITHQGAQYVTSVNIDCQ
ncbi:MAG: hypothetical protein ABI220_00820 [Candidatus Saccharimonadales bacterium]